MTYHLNRKAFNTLSVWVNWYMIVIILSAVLASYCLLFLVRMEKGFVNIIYIFRKCLIFVVIKYFLLQVFSLVHISLKEPLALHWLHKVQIYFYYDVLMFETDVLFHGLLQCTKLKTFRLIFCSDFAEGND